MLEKQGLLIMPWSSPAGLPPEDVAGLTRIRRIQDPTSGSLLGFAGWSRQSWWRGTTIRVFEIPDASLLMTILRPWGLMRMWQVFDAEERRIGRFYHQALFDGMGYLLAQLEDEKKQQRPRRFISRRATELGSWELDEDAGRLIFTATPDPFTRMNLLAKILTLPPLPSK